MFRPQVIGAFSWPSIDDAKRAAEAAGVIPDKAEKGIRDTVRQVSEQVSPVWDEAKGHAKQQLEQLSEQVGEGVGQGASTSIKQSFVPWVVGGAVVATAAFLVLRDRR